MGGETLIDLKRHLEMYIVFRLVFFLNGYFYFSPGLVCETACSCFFYVVVLYVHENDLHKENEFTCICKLIEYTIMLILSSLWELSLQDGERTLDVFFYLIFFFDCDICRTVPQTGSSSSVTKCKT